MTYQIIYQFFYIAGNFASKPIQDFLIKSVRCINDKTLSDFNKSLQSTDWSALHDISCTDKAFETFDQTFNHIYNKSLPTKSIRIKLRNKQSRPWLSVGILNSVNKKHKLYTKFLRNKTVKNKNDYIKYRN